MPSIANTIRPWPWCVLHYPAVSSDREGPVPSIHAVALDWAVDAASRAVGELLGHTARLEQAESSATIEAFRPAGGATISIGGVLDELSVVLDLHAARLLVDGITAAEAGIVAPAGGGPVAELTTAELGLLDYALTAVLDRLVRAAPTHAADIVLHGLLDARDAATRLGGIIEDHVIEFALGCGGVPGRVRVAISGWTPRQWSALHSMTRIVRPAEELTVHLALPPIPLAAEERRMLAAGDVLLCGGPDLLRLGGSCRLRTDLGWTLCDATITSDQPSSMLVTGAAIRPRVERAMLDDTVVQPLLGACSCTIGEAQAWTDGVEMTLAKDAAAPVRLAIGAEVAGRGELVLLDGELGIRIVSLDLPGRSPTPEQTPAAEQADEVETPDPTPAAGDA